MRIAIISDTHFGDPDCMLKPNRQLQAFLDCIGEIDYLVLLGDALDFSISSYGTAYADAKIFFQAVADSGKVKRVLYVPGNHDSDVWHIVEHETTVMQNIKDGRPVGAFRHSIPGIIDDRGGKGCLRLYGVNHKKETGGCPEYGGLFMDQLTDGKLPIYIAYPNVYLLTDTETVLLTHGQYFDPFWSVSGELVMYLAKDDIFRITEADALNIQRMMEVNFPLTRLSCTGIGQAGVLSKLALEIQKEVKEHGATERVKRYLKLAKRWLDKEVLFNSGNFFDRIVGVFKEFGSDVCLKGIFDKAADEISKLKNASGARHNEKYLLESKPRIKNFYLASLRELDDINDDPQWKGNEIAMPARFIFGHTHVSIPYQSPVKLGLVEGQKDTLFCNTGGWLDERGCWGEIFLYDTKAGFTSESIKWPHTTKN